MDDIILELKTLLSASMASRITSFYYGEVMLVPKSYTPALMIVPISSEVIAKSTAKDQVKSTILVRVVISLTDFLKDSGTGDTIKAQQELVKIMEERSAGTYKADTVLGTLRDADNVRGDSYLFNNNISVQYSTVQRGEFFYAQAEATLEAVTDLILRP